MELPNTPLVSEPSPAPLGDDEKQDSSPEHGRQSLVVSGTPVEAPLLELPETPTVLDDPQVAPLHGPFPHNLPAKLGLVLGQNGVAYATIRNANNPYALPVGSRKLNNVIRAIARGEGLALRKADLGDINSMLQAHAETAGVMRSVWYRVAPLPGGIEIDLGDADHTRVRISAGKVEILTAGSDTLFYRTQVSQPFVIPADAGNIDLLKKYLNVDAVSTVLLFAWLTYTLAHPKLSATKYPILVLQGDQGSGKTALCNNVIREVLDPNRVGVQVLPSNPKDLAIAAQNAHVLFYDNVRALTVSMSDLLCIAATGGALSARQLYSDADQSVLYLHVALVLNGIHSFIEQPDLAQRCLPIELLPLAENNRKSEAQMVRDFQADLPAILRGLFELIAKVLTHLPTAVPTNPERMLDFVLWLAAMEQAQGAPAGVYQAAYSDALRQGQLDSLLDNALAAAVLEFAQAQKDGYWKGAPADLFAKLNAQVTSGTQRSRDWPQNAISLSKKLAPLRAGLLSQGVKVDFTRGKFRTITINFTTGEIHE